VLSVLESRVDSCTLMPFLQIPLLSVLISPLFFGLLEAQEV
jgi:hypothetical protein